MILLFLVYIQSNTKNKSLLIISLQLSQSVHQKVYNIRACLFTPAVSESGDDVFVAEFYQLFFIALEGEST